MLAARIGTTSRKGQAPPGPSLNPGSLNHMHIGPHASGQDNDEQTSAAAASARDRSSAGAPTVADCRYRGAECRLPMGELAGKRSARGRADFVGAVAVADRACTAGPADAARRGFARQRCRDRWRAPARRSRCRRSPRADWVAKRSWACRSTPLPKLSKSIQLASTMRWPGRLSRPRANRVTAPRSAAKDWPISRTPAAFPSWRSVVSTRPGSGKCSPAERPASRSWAG